MDITTKYLFIIIGFLILIVWALFYRRFRPGAKNLREAIRNRSVKDAAKVVLTQRLFGFGDFGLADKKVTSREVIFVVILILVMLIAVIFF